jgi:hypothetical protein
MLPFSSSAVLGMLPTLTVALGLACSSDSTPPGDTSGLRVETVVTGLDTPWDLA